MTSYWLTEILHPQSTIWYHLPLGMLSFCKWEVLCWVTVGKVSNNWSHSSSILCNFWFDEKWWRALRIFRVIGHWFGLLICSGPPTHLAKTGFGYPMQHESYGYSSFSKFHHHLSEVINLVWQEGHYFQKVPSINQRTYVKCIEYFVCLETPLERYHLAVYRNFHWLLCGYFGCHCYRFISFWPTISTHDYCLNSENGSQQWPYKC